MFCTNGVLLRMLTSGDGLEGVTHIVVDEIHERDKFADFLLIMLRDLLPSKPHLHLLLMSATLNVQLFTDYFSGCPLLQVPGYTYPVQVLPFCSVKSICYSSGRQLGDTALSNEASGRQLSLELHDACASCMHCYG